MCWLSPGNVTKRVFELRRELVGFFPQSNQCKIFVTFLRDSSFVESLAYLVDIFDALNMLKQCRQGKKVAVCEFS